MFARQHPKSLSSNHYLIKSLFNHQKSKSHLIDKRLNGFCIKSFLIGLNKPFDVFFQVFVKTWPRFRPVVRYRGDRLILGELNCLIQYYGYRYPPLAFKQVLVDPVSEYPSALRYVKRWFIQRKRRYCWTKSRNFADETLETAPSQKLKKPWKGNSFPTRLKYRREGKFTHIGSNVWTVKTKFKNQILCVMIVDSRHRC